jgi:O-antigen ligase
LNVGLIFGIGSVLTLVFGGSLFQFLKTAPGRLAMVFLAGTALSIPTSHWASDSLSIWQVYASRTFVFLLFVPAFVYSMPSMTRFLNLAIFGMWLFLITCMLYANPHPEHGRLIIPDSPYYNNPNDLGIQLMLTIPFLLYWMSQSKLALKLLAMPGIAVVLWFLIKTASRGAFLGLILCFLIQFVVSKQKAMIGALGAISLVFFLLMSSDVQSRLLLVFSPNLQTERDRGSGGVGEARASSNERKHVATRAAEMSIQNPLTGVGMGQFANVLWAEGVEKKVHEAALGTHNSYLQISSETGLISLGAYIGLMVMAIRRFIRIYRVSVSYPALTELKAQSLCWFSYTIAFGVVALFHHIGFSYHFPLLVGACIAMELYSRPLLQRFAVQTPFPVTPQPLRAS